MSENDHSPLTIFTGPQSGGPGSGGAVSSVFGRTGAVAGQAGDYSFSQISGTVAATQLPLFTATANGAVAASGGGTTNFLRADGTWATPAGSGGGTVNSVSMTVPAGLAVTGSPITNTGTLAVTWSGTIPPSSLPPPGASTLGGTQSGTAPANQFMTGISTAGVPTFAQPAFANISGQATLAQLPAIPTNTVLGNNTAGTATPIALTRAQLTALINVFTSALPGDVPASGGGTSNFLRADGSWSAPPAGVTSVFGRTGVVTAQTGDYSFSQISGVAAPAQLPLFTAAANGAVSASGGGTSNFLRADGSWSTPPAPVGVGININTLTSSPLVGDGVTPNDTQYKSLLTALQTVGKEFPVPVTLTVGTPTVVTLNNHYLKPNQAFYFTVSGGSLPSGITAGTTYYVKSTNLTLNTFTFSTVNNSYNSAFTWGTTEGAAVNTTGTATGTISVVFTGRMWLDVFFPPGAYATTYAASSGANYYYLVPNGISRIRWYAYGAMFDEGTIFGASAYLSTAANWTFETWDYVATTPNQYGAPGINGQVTLTTTAHAANYFVGQWVTLLGLDIQDQLGTLTSGPPNNHYQEYKQIIAIDTVGGTLTFDGPLKWNYLSTFPTLINNPGGFLGGGSALISPMHPNWDVEVEVYGAQWAGEAPEAYARKMKYVDCVWQGYKSFPGRAVPTLAQEFKFRNCRFVPQSAGSDYMEIDKMLEYLEFESCYAINTYQYLFPSTSVHLCVMRNHKGGTVTGTPRQIRITESELDALFIGPAIGVTDAVVIRNSRIVWFDLQERFDSSRQLAPGNDMSLVPNWSFANGTFTRNMTGVAQSMSWQIPGSKMYFIDAANIFTFDQNLGSPFAILNVTIDGSGNFSFETTLKAIPTRQTSHTITITIASPGVITWTAHGLTAGTPVCFTTTGALPTGLSISTIYYVIATGLTANTFEVSATVGGAAINTSGTQSGVHTAYGHPLCFLPHPCPRFSGTGNSGSTTLADMNGAVDEPMFSRAKRAMVAQQDTVDPNLQFPWPKIWGTLISMTINVVQAGTSGTMQVSAPGFTQPNLTQSNFSQTVALTVAGRRVVTSTAVTGNQTGDTLTAYANWIAGPITFVFAGVPAGTVNNALIEWEITTDQGITRFGTMNGYPNAGIRNWMYSDSGLISVL